MDNCIQNFHWGGISSDIRSVIFTVTRELCLKLKRCNLHKTACNLRKCDVINGVKLFPKVHHRIYFDSRNYCLMLSNQMLIYKGKCIRIRYHAVHEL